MGEGHSGKADCLQVLKRQMYCNSKYQQLHYKKNTTFNQAQQPKSSIANLLSAACKILAMKSESAASGLVCFQNLLNGSSLNRGLSVQILKMDRTLTCKMNSIFSFNHLKTGK